MFSRFQYISQGTTPADHLRHIQRALEAGCEWVQLRYKGPLDADFLKMAAQVRQLCTAYKATFILNDHPAVAREVGADGVHLGLADMPVREAREIVGDKIIGGTANTLADVLQRVDEGCDYVGLGPFRFTITKEKLSPILGLEGYQQIYGELRKRQLYVPLYAIGGITQADIPAILQTGVHGIAASGLLTHHETPSEFFTELNSLLYATSEDRR